MDDFELDDLSSIFGELSDPQNFSISAEPSSRRRVSPFSSAALMGEEVDEWLSREIDEIATPFDDELQERMSQDNLIAQTSPDLPSSSNQKPLMPKTTNNEQDESEPTTSSPPLYNWTKLSAAAAAGLPPPTPRNGHRAVIYNNHLMIIFGGGNCRLYPNVNVYDLVKQEWHQPKLQGHGPIGLALFGMVLDGGNILIFGGMAERGYYSSELFELNIATWKWRRFTQRAHPTTNELPCARIGHSFTVVPTTTTNEAHSSIAATNNEIYLFGGLANLTGDPSANYPRFLNDLHSLHWSKGGKVAIWDSPITFGEPPSPRESHTAVAYCSGKCRKLIVFGGMCGWRLGDCHMLDLDSKVWIKPDLKGPHPAPKSLHTANIIGERMFIFGGWVPYSAEELISRNGLNQWKCSNALDCLNLETFRWDSVHKATNDAAAAAAHQTLNPLLRSFPQERAGHCAVVFNGKMFVWSGRNEYKDAVNGMSFCYDDMWRLDVDGPAQAEKVRFRGAGIDWVDVTWTVVPCAQSYLLQCMEIETPVGTNSSALLQLSKVEGTEKNTASKMAKEPAVTKQGTAAQPSQQPRQLNQREVTAVPEPASSSPIGGAATSLPKIAPISKVCLRSSSKSLAAATTSTESIGKRQAQCTPLQTKKPPPQRITKPTQKSLETSPIASFSKAASSSSFLQPQQQQQQFYQLVKTSKGTTFVPIAYHNVAATTIVRSPLPSSSRGFNTLIPPSPSLFSTTLRQSIPAAAPLTRGPRHQPIIIRQIISPRQQPGQQVQRYFVNPTTTGRLITPSVAHTSSSITAAALYQSQAASSRFNNLPPAQCLPPPSIEKIFQSHQQLQSGSMMSMPPFHQIIGGGGRTGQVSPQQIITSSSLQLHAPMQSHELPQQPTTQTSDSGEDKKGGRGQNKGGKGGLKGGGTLFGPWTRFNFSRDSTMMKLRGGMDNNLLESNGNELCSQNKDEAANSSASQNGKSTANCEAMVVSHDKDKCESQDAPVAVKEEIVPPEIKLADDTSSEETNKTVGKWMDVCHTRSTAFSVKHLYNVSEKLSKLPPDGDLSNELEISETKIPLKPGRSYKFRVAGVNSCGIGPWSEVTVAKTTVPGLPGPLNGHSVKVMRASDTIQITWDPVENPSGTRMKYVVLVGVKTAQDSVQTNAIAQAEKVNGGGSAPKSAEIIRPFFPIYRGPLNSCKVSISAFDKGFVDTSSGKPAILLRILAVNEIGQGPLCQIRWLYAEAVTPGGGMESYKPAIIRKPPTQVPLLR